MNILVCISKTPDTTTKISFKDGDTKFDENGVQFIINPYDEWYALVRALELKEAQGGKVTVITVGGADCDPIIRKALAIGADEAVRVDSAPEDAMFVARQIAAYVSGNPMDLILCGKETIDYNGSEVGGMLAEMLDIPFVSLATHLDFAAGTSTVTREVQGGSEVLEISGSAVISAAKGMAEQRIPNMRGIMAARTKPLNVIPAVDANSPTKISKYTLPAGKAECRYIDAENPEELIQLLHDEAKVI